MEPTTVVSFEDLQCPDSADYRKLVDELRGRYGGTVLFESRDFPLPKHNWAREAAIASRFFGSVSAELGSRFRSHCYTHQNAINVGGFARACERFAKENDIDLASNLDNDALKRAVEQDYQEGLARGVNKTPTVFVNGETLVERFTSEELSRAIEKA